MPGVLSNYHCGFSRAVGKMAFFTDPDLLSFDTSGDITESIFEAPHFFLENPDSDCDLPDNEHPVDLIKYLDSPDLDVEHQMHRHKLGETCESCAGNYSRYSFSTGQDPFMGLWSNEHLEESPKPSTSAYIHEQLMKAFDDSWGEDIMQQKFIDMKTFSAWNTPNSEEESDFLSKIPTTWHVPFEEDDDNDEAETPGVTYPDTPSPSAPSGTNTGDDSDVDIETVTEAPRSIDSCGYITHDSSPETSPTASPQPFRKFQNGTHTFKYKSVSRNSMQLSSENRSNFLGQKRKLSKDKKFTYKTQAHTVYQHVLCNSNSVNFHDYAMSPGACLNPTTSTETGRPTVLSKRIYKRHITVDAPGKEKQHHHNQLERNRRQKLADLFVRLRDHVPKISNQGKASKVLILKEATQYIHDLNRLDKQQEDVLSREKRREESLKSQLRHLQTQISSHCVK